MPNGDDEDKLLDQLAERLKAIRQDAELVRSGGIEGITGALERVQTGLRDLAASVEALSLRVEQQQAISARVEAAATKGHADTKALSQTVEALSVRMRQQAEKLDRLSTPRRSRFGTFRFALMIAVLVVGGGMVTFLISAHKAGFGPLSHLFIGWFSGGTRLTRSGDASTGPAQAMTNATPDSVSASAPLAPSDSAAMSPVALAQTKDNAPAIATASATAAPPPATPVGVETHDRAQAAIALLPAQSPAVDVAQPPEAPAPAPSAPIDTSKSPPASTEARREVPAATIAPAPGKFPAPDAAVPSGATLSTSTMPPARSIPSPPATAMAVSSQVPKATPQLV
ncbi:MAG TPA: hypothetical protein VL475_15370, partial [Planctomycetaceae bacterium]|nr:hypothetical protein [Planctomycetaceae bacterium]